MKSLSRISFVLMTLTLSMATASPALAKKSLPAINDEGMELVKNTKMTTIYADPGADLSIYNRIWLKDATGGFKGFRRQTLEKIDLSRVHSDGYGFQIEMNYKVWHKGLRVKEIPILFVDRRVGISKMNRKIIWEAMWLVWKLRLQALTGRL